MKWQLRSDAPIYSQLIEHIKLGIVSGEFPPGGKLRPSGIRSGGRRNPNTMQRAFTELERRAGKRQEDFRKICNGGSRND